MRLRFNDGNPNGHVVHLLRKQASLTLSLMDMLEFVGQILYN